MHRKNRRGRILLRRRHRQSADDTDCDLGAAVPFYGPQPSADEAAKIKAPLQVHYAENDDWVNKGWPAYETALKAAGVKFEMFKYPGTQHGFNNDTTPRYDEKQAKIAWGRTVEFFNKSLRK